MADFRAMECKSPAAPETVGCFCIEGAVVEVEGGGGGGSEGGSVVGLGLLEEGFVGVEEDLSLSK